MDLSFEQIDWQTDAGRGLGTAGESCTPDWHELHIRLSTALAARRAMAELGNTSALQSGSFDKRAADALAVILNSSLPVNPTALGNVKVNGGIVANTAGESMLVVEDTHD